ncbi:hypothetical protein GH714_040375 [Hevea brasiliensis]|uniref:Uncharacterized protein n=1 Tax=Hevea brasiliensis TaxID=3981 RepID=A0A6A6MPX8_HEVBR|nr:hypothetical protein GH714_040375 [Hevea brasiliensis]
MALDSFGSQVPIAPQVPLMVPQVSPISSGVPRLSATSSTLRIHTPPAFPMPSANLFSYATVGSLSCTVATPSTAIAQRVAPYKKWNSTPS